VEICQPNSTIVNSRKLAKAIRDRFSLEVVGVH
jgi:hypothetical protein